MLPLLPLRSLRQVPVLLQPRLNVLRVPLNPLRLTPDRIKTLRETLNERAPLLFVLEERLDGLRVGFRGEGVEGEFDEGGDGEIPAESLHNRVVVRLESQEIV
jgi:hypothetical protein